MRLPLLLVALALAGCAGNGHVHGGALDTGDIPPGESASLTFADAGELTIHCHPHPWMEQTVRVTDAEPTEVHVHVLDGEAMEEYRYDPPTLDVGAGSVVTYHNHGALSHTATQKE